VTGGSRGIGAATARRLAAAGWSVCLSYRSAQDEAHAVVAACTAEGVDARAVQADVADPEAIAGLFRAADELGRLGALVNAVPSAPRVATVSNVSVPKWRAEILIAALDVEGLCASAGAACSSGVGEASPVLRALYPNEPWRAESALRLSLGPETTDDEITEACAIVQRVLGRGA